jgi:ribosomal protein L40E
MGKKICPNCGEENSGFEIFCKKCNTNIEKVPWINQSSSAEEKNISISDLPFYDHELNSIFNFVKGNNPTEEILTAVQFIKENKKNEAGKKLIDLLKVDQSDENAWLLLSYCLNDKDKKVNCLKKVVSINLKNILGWELLSKFEEDDEKRKYYEFRAKELKPPAPIQEKKKDLDHKNQRSCYRCGSINKISATFCWNCGQNMNVKSNVKSEVHDAILFEKEVDSGAKALGSISVVCGVIGIFVFGIPLGIIAIACGIPALSKGANSGKTGIVLGILDIVLAICVLLI